MEEIIFQSNEEAIQALADITGKRILVPEKTKISKIVEDEEITNAESPLSETIEKTEQNLEKLKSLDAEIQETLDSVK